MPNPLGYSTDGETVTLTMTADDYANLMVNLGLAAGTASRDGSSALLYRQLALANRLNADNPNWTPYEIPPEKAPEDSR